MNDDLKPCPFCGGEAALQSSVGDPFGEARVSFRAVCKRPMCQGGACNVWEATPEEATAKWNARAERTCRVEYPEDVRMCSECCYYVGPNNLYCAHCGAKVVG